MDSGLGSGDAAGAIPDWTAGLPEDLRRINRAMIEQEIRDMTDANMPSSAAANASELFEEGIFKESITEYDYLTMISEFIDMIHRQPGYFEGVKPLELDEDAPPEEQRGKGAMGPATSLIQQHYEVAEFLMRLAILYTQLLDLSARTMGYSTDQQIITHRRRVLLQRGWACARLWRALLDLKSEIEMNEYQDNEESNEMINSPSWYEEKIHGIFKSFSDLIMNDNQEEEVLDLLQQNLPATDLEALDKLITLHAEEVANIVESALYFLTEQQQE